MRLRNEKKSKDIIANSEFYISKFPIKLHGTEVLEVGSGKGQMITELALKNADTIFYAVEKYESVAVKIIQKIEKLNIKNLYVICEDAKVLSELFEGCFKTIWLTFSDPWPKRRHEKRRLTYRSFLDNYYELLCDKGKLKLKTDNLIFFQYSVDSLRANNWVILNKTFDLHRHQLGTKNISTEYEKKWTSLGEKIKYLEAKKH